MGDAARRSAAVALAAAGLVATLAGCGGSGRVVGPPGRGHGGGRPRWRNAAPT